MAIETTDSLEQGRVKINGSFLAHLPVHADAAASVTLTSMASAAQHFPNGSGLHHLFFDATYYISIRLCARVVTLSGSANSPRLYVQYTTDLTGASGWTTIGAGTTASGEALALGSTGVKKTSWTALPAGAKAEILLRCAQEGGDASASPVVSGVHIQLKTS